MGAVVSLLIVAVLSVLITRIATVALVHTGLSLEVARFQARSALTGAGFTSQESEQVVNHPVRRRIIRYLMLVGNAGIITAVSSLILSFVSISESGESRWIRLGALAAGLFAVFLFSKSRVMERALSGLIGKMLRRFTNLDTRDFVGLLRLAGNYTISELQCQQGDWLADRTLRELNLSDEGLLVLGIHRRKGKFLGAPTGDTCVRRGDTLLLYGTLEQIKSLDEREQGLGGDLEHARGVEAQQSRQEAEQERDSAAA